MSDKQKTYYSNWYQGKLDMPVLFTEDELGVMTALVKDDTYRVTWHGPRRKDAPDAPQWTIYKSHPTTSTWKSGWPHEWVQQIGTRAELVALARLLVGTM